MILLSNIRKSQCLDYIVKVLNCFCDTSFLFFSFSFAFSLTVSSSIIVDRESAICFLSLDVIYKKIRNKVWVYQTDKLVVGRWDALTVA